MIINEKRALAYSARINWVSPIQGADNIELVGVNGWTCIAKIGEFHEGDLAIYFEIDSRLPEKDWSAFMEAKHYKVKTMKLGKFKVISQGLALPYAAFTGYELPNEENVDVTELLEITYSVAEDNSRKGAQSKYDLMKVRHSALFKKKPIAWLFNREWGKKLLFVFFGKKKDSKMGFPTHFEGVHKTDQERVENMTWVLKNKEPFIVTEKIEGTSSTYILDKTKRKPEFYILSRNVRQTDDTKATYHGTDENVYWQVAEKYHIREFLNDYIDKNGLKWAAIQGETVGTSEKGAAVQENIYGFTDLRFFAFHLIDSESKSHKGVLESKAIANAAGIEWVPIVDENYILPDNLDEFKKIADGKTIAPGAMTKTLREGYVYYSKANPSFSFKNVSNAYLLKKRE